jgi:transposase-like protein
VPVRHDREFWERACREIRRGGKVSEVAARLGVRSGTLSWWLWKLRGERAGRKAGARTRFLPVVVSEPLTTTPLPTRSVALEFDGVRVHVEVGTDVAYVAALVRAIRSAC